VIITKQNPKMLVWVIPLCFERKGKVSDPQTQMFFRHIFSSPPLPHLRRIMLPLLLVNVHVAGSLEYPEKFRESASCERSTDWANHVTYKINYTIIVPTKCTSFIKSTRYYNLYFCLCILSPHMFQPTWTIFRGRNASA
jgi:hypothetical protein